MEETLPATDNTEISRGRVFFGGVLATAVHVGMGWVVVRLYLDDFAAVMAEVGHPLQGTPRLWAAWGLISFGLGIMSLWLYAALRPRYGAGPGSAIIAGSVIWLLAALSAAIWVTLGVMEPRALLIPTLPYLAIFILATLAGARVYRESPKSETVEDDDDDHDE